MRALTLWRPWDTAILYLGKPVENRDWPCPPGIVGQRIALHSGKKYDVGGAARVIDLARKSGIDAGDIVRRLERAERFHSVVLGTVKIARVIRRRGAHATYRELLTTSVEDPLAASPWFFGDFGWVCEDPFPLPEPVPCKGMQGLWTLPPDVERRVRTQEARRG